MKSLIFVFLMLFQASLFCSEKTKEELEKKGEDKLESSIVNFGMGILETGAGAFRAYGGDPIGGAIGVGAGVKSFKDSYDDFVEAADYYEQSREVEDDE